MTTQRRHTNHLFTALMVTLLLPASLIQTSWAQSTSAGDAPGAARPGWYLGLGAGGAALSLDDAVEQRFSSLNVDLSETGQGGSLFVGYSFSNRLNLELNLSGRELTTGRNDIEATLVGFDIVAIAPLMPQARVSPYLLGSVGGGGLVFMGDGIDDKSLVAGQVGIGGGVELHVSRRFSLDFDYRVAVQHYQEEVLDLRVGGDQRVDFEGSGVAQRWGMRVVFSF
jgi:Outer membrane protein beta-barrel domain